MRRAALGVLFLLCVGPAHADEASHREAAYRLLELTGSQKTIDQIIESMDAMMTQQLAALDLPAEGTAAAEKMLDELMVWFAEEFDWEAMSEFLVDTWVEVFTEEEVQGMVDFYLTPLGQKLIEKQPLVMQRSMEWAGQRVQALMPELQSRMETVVAELQEQYGAAGPGS